MDLRISIDLIEYTLKVTYHGKGFSRASLSAVGKCVCMYSMPSWKMQSNTKTM